MRPWALFFAGWVMLWSAGLATVRSLCSPPPNARPQVIHLVDELAKATQVVQDRTRLEPPALYLQPGPLSPPPGFRLQAEPHAIGRFVADAPRRFAMRIEMPVEPGRDYRIVAEVRDPSHTAELLVEHTPNSDQPETGWHHATVERADDEARFDWRQTVGPQQHHLALLLVVERTQLLTLRHLGWREAGSGDPAIVEPGASSVLHGLVERPIEGDARAQSDRAHAPTRLVTSLLSSPNGVYEWPMVAPSNNLSVQTALVPRGPLATAPVTLIVEVKLSTGWQEVLREIRNTPGDRGGWRTHQLMLPTSARRLRLRTEGDSRDAPIVAWGDPVLRAPTPAHPNVLLITLDAVRADHLSSYGYPRPTSPVLDSLAKRGVRFSDVRAQRGHTWVSTTSLIEGLWPESSGVTARGARPERGLVGAVDAFARAGYQTVRIGSPDLPRGQLSGFHIVETANYDVDIINRLISYAHSDGPPLFIWVHLSNAHYPWHVAPQFNIFDPEYRGTYANSLSRAEFHALIDQGNIDEKTRNHLVALYDGSIRQMDSELARALDALDRRGFFAPGILAVTADHGTHLGEHDVWFLHSTPWLANLRVPLFIVAPDRLPAGIVVPADRGRVLLVDLMPTLLDLAGLDASEGQLDGISLRPLWSGGRLPNRTTVTQFLPAHYRRIENDDFVLLDNPLDEPLAWPGEFTRSLPLPHLGLYRQTSDNSEAQDLAASQPEVLGQLQAVSRRVSTQNGPALSTEARRLLILAGYASDH